VHKFAVDISEDLAQIIEESWARPEPVPPYQIYLKMAFHLFREAQEELKEFRIPPVFGKELSTSSRPPSVSLQVTSTNGMA